MHSDEFILSGPLPIDLERERRREFERLLTEHRHQLFLYIFSLVHSTQDAEDICQLSSVVMWRKYSQFDRSRSFLAWACGIARLETLSHRRSLAMDKLVFSSDVMQLLATTLEGLECEAREERLAALRRCMDKLSPVNRGIFRRLYAEGCQFEEVAAELGCTLRTLYNRMYFLRRRLLECVRRSLGSDIVPGDADTLE